MSIIEVYEKHKHFDRVLSDPQFCEGSAIAAVARELWLAIKEAAEQCVNADVCPRCDGTGRTRNDGFVWVACPACDGAGIRR